MGTSGSFKGSGGKDAASLRSAISDWLSDAPANDQPTPSPTSNSTPALAQATNHINFTHIAPVLRLWGRGPGGGGGGGGTGGGHSVRASGGVQRSIRSVAAPAGRATAIVSAYVSGNRQALEAAGLNYDELRALNDPLEVGRRIVSVAFESQPDSSIEDSESRLIVAELVSWMMDTPEGSPREPVDVVRQSIELMILQATLSEVGATIRDEKDVSKRRQIESEIKEAAHVLAGKANIDPVRATAADISTAIERGVSQLTDIYGVST